MISARVAAAMSRHGLGNPSRLLFWYYGLRGLSLIYLPLADFRAADGEQKQSSRERDGSREPACCQ